MRQMDEWICSAWLFPWSSGTIGYMKDREERQSHVPAQSVRPRVVCLHALVIQPKHCYKKFGFNILPFFIYNCKKKNRVVSTLYFQSNMLF